MLATEEDLEQIELEDWQPITLEESLELQAMSTAHLFDSLPIPRIGPARVCRERARAKGAA